MDTKIEKLITDLNNFLSDLESLKKSQTNLLQEFDKDGNGVIDVIEGIDDFI